MRIVTVKRNYIYGDLRGLVGTYGDLWGMYGGPIGNLRGSMGRLRIRDYGSDLWGSRRLSIFKIYVWGCGARPMGLYGESRFLSWLRFWTYGAYEVAAPDLWVSVVNLHCCCGCVLGPMGWTYGAIGPYGDFQGLV